MSDWSHDEAPHVRPLSDGHGHLMAWLIAILAVIGMASYYFHEYWSLPEPAGLRSPVKDLQLADMHSEDMKAPAGIGMPKAATDQSLPTLANSDSMIRRSLVDLLGRDAFNDLVVPDQLVRRIVATVDNLPRPTAPRRMIPLSPVPGPLLVMREGEKASLDPANGARYEPYVAVFEAVQVRALVYSYVRAYPLFQRAYEELGYPGQIFHERLVQAIDDMLAAPEVNGPIRLVRPRVLYEFFDPDMEARSAGQKIMIRMGRANALRVKAKLRELREALLAASQGQF